MPATVGTRPTSIPYHPALDGFRGIGITAMLVYHLGLGHASGAFLALSMFFTLSGFLIASQLLAQHAATGAIDLPGFWERRVRRLLPAALLGLALVLALTTALAPLHEISRFAGDVLAALFYVPNWRFVFTHQGYDAIFSDPSPVQHFWSLGVEEQFYLLFPLLVAGVLARRSRPTLAAIVALLAVASSLTLMISRTDGAPLGHAYYGTDTRAAEFLGGVLLAIWLSSRTAAANPGSARWLGAAGGAALIATMVLWLTTSEHQLWFYRGGAPAYTLLTGAVIAAAIQPTLVRTLLAWGPFVFVGKISYGLYIYHWPIYLSLDALDPATGPGGLIALKLGATAAVALLSYYLVEAPIRSRRALTGRRWWLAPILGSGLVASAAIALLVSYGAFALPISRHPAQPHVADLESKGSDTIRVLFVGPSIAAGLAEGFDAWSPDGVGVFDGSQNGCGFLREGQVVSGQGIELAGAQGRCVRWSAGWSSTVEEVDPHVVVLLASIPDFADRQIDGWSGFQKPGQPDFDDWTVSQFVDLVDLFAARGAAVAWLTAPCTLHNALGGKWRNSGALEAERVAAFNDGILPRIAAARRDSVSVVDLFAHACPDGEFIQQLGGIEWARGDGVHFRPAAAVWIAERIGPAILRLAEPEP